MLLAFFISFLPPCCRIKITLCSNNQVTCVTATGIITHSDQCYLTKLCPYKKCICALCVQFRSIPKVQQICSEPKYLVKNLEVFGKNLGSVCLLLHTQHKVTPKTHHTRDILRHYYMHYEPLRRP